MRIAEKNKIDIQVLVRSGKRQNVMVGDAHISPPCSIASSTGSILFDHSCDYIEHIVCSSYADLKRCQSQGFPVQVLIVNPYLDILLFLCEHVPPYVAYCYTVGWFSWLRQENIVGYLNDSTHVGYPKVITSFAFDSTWSVHYRHYVGWWNMCSYQSAHFILEYFLLRSQSISFSR